VRKLLLLASAVVLVETSFYAAITPLLPGLTEQYGLTKAGAGVLAASYPAGVFAGALPGGWLAARAGVRQTMLLGLALMTVASVGFAFGDSILMLDVSRFVQGIGGAFCWAGAMGWIGAAAPRDQRGQMIGTVMGAAIAGALLGPVIGVAADLAGHAAVFCGIGALGVVLILWTLRFASPPPGIAPSWRGLWRSLENADVRLGLTLIMLPALLFGTIGVLAPLRLHELGASAAAIGAIWLVGAGAEAVVSPWAGRLSDRRGRMTPILAGVAGGGIVCLLQPWPDSAAVLGALIILGAPAIGLLWAPSMAMLSDGAEAAGVDQGLAFGAWNLTWSTGQALGDVGGAGLGQAAGNTVAYLTLAALSAIVFVALRVRSRRPVAA
jgi:MFS family permease